MIEGFRPGVAERLGIGPYALLARNPALAYGRMTGWGQDGPLAAEPGHDINFIALSGALHAIGPADEPVVPLNLIGDMGGGGMLLAFGLLAGILSARSTGRGQVVDAAMTDGSATLLAMIHGFLNAGGWEDERERNSIDGGSPCYGSIAAPTTGTSPSASGTSGRTGPCSRFCDSRTTRTSPTDATAPRGEPCARLSARSSAVAIAMPGSACSPAGEPV